MTESTPTVWDEIRRTTDELELKIHLGSMEARDRWHALQPRLTRLKQAMEAKTTEASAWVAEELTGVGDLVRELRDDIVARTKN